MQAYVTHTTKDSDNARNLQPDEATSNTNKLRYEPTDCVVCGEKHHSNYCMKYKEMNNKGKMDLLKREMCCFNCLTIAHIAKTCRSKYRCKVCGKKHHITIHRYKQYADNDFDSENKSTSFKNNFNEAAVSVKIKKKSVDLSAGMIALTTAPLRVMILHVRTVDCTQ